MRETAQQAADRIREERRAAGTLGQPVDPPRVIGVYKGLATTKVLLEGDSSHDEALGVALTAAGETRDSLFGWNVGELGDDGRRTVALYTD